MFPNNGVTYFRDNLQKLLSNYLIAKRDNNRGIVDSSLVNLQQSATSLFGNNNNLTTRYGYAIGAWADVPWLAILDLARPATVQAGEYIVYLFKKDMTGVYLTLNQGVSQIFNDLKKKKGKSVLRDRTEYFRKSLSEEDKVRLTERGFSLENDIFLAPSGTGQDYEPGTFINKYYSSGNLPVENEIVNDLQLLIEVYIKLPRLASRLVNDVVKVGDKIGQYENEEESMSGWREDVLQALINLGGKARLAEIYSEVAKLRPKPLIPSHDDTVRRTLQENSSDTDSYKGKYDIFSHIGHGIWALKNYPNEPDLPPRVPIDLPEPNDQLIGFSVHTFFQALANTNLQFDDLFVIRFIASLLAKKFTILTGLSGSGKTKLAITFANWISESSNQVCLVPVGADWTNREPLLGFSNALVKGSYVKPDTGVIDLLIRAEKDPTRPYFLILDEMNLSHVERYFADFLSAMESGERILLHSDDQKDWNGCDVPATISIPNNLFIIGTVNVDETTYMFSPKVLDRAFVHEFRVSSKDMRDFLENPLKADTSKIDFGGKTMARDFLEKAGASYRDFYNSEVLKDKISLFFNELKTLGSEFGYRTASEIYRYGAILSTFDENGSVGINNIIDAAVVSKLLPKIHGSRRKLEQTLMSLFKLCIVNPEGEDINDYVSRKKEVVGNENIALPVSLDKIVRMYRQVIQDGFTSFSEA